MADHTFKPTALIARQGTKLLPQAEETSLPNPTTTSYAPIPAITSFPLNPLTSTYTPPAICNGLYNSLPLVAMIDPFPTCLPPSFTPAASAYYSPGIACPVGYSTACHDNSGVASITTVTCCPFRQGVTLSCVPTPQSLAGVFETLFCTWAAGLETSISMTLSEGGRTSTGLVGFRAPGGFNARGVRMVYQESDLSTGTVSGSRSGSPTASVTGTNSETATPKSTIISEKIVDGGMPIGVKIGVGVAVPVLVVILVAALFLLWRGRRRRRNEGGDGVQEHGEVQQLDSNPLHEMEQQEHREVQDKKGFQYRSWRSSQRPVELQ